MHGVRILLQAASDTSEQAAGRGDVAAETEAEEQPRHVPSQMQLSPQLGFLPNDSELHSGFMTVHAGLAWCGERADCGGMTVRVPSPGDTDASVLYMTFHPRSEVVPDSAWYTWVKQDERGGVKQKEEL